jgi:hypothetical protein
VTGSIKRGYRATFNTLTHAEVGATGSLGPKAGGGVP